jgi:hypothetical protein
MKRKCEVCLVEVTVNKDDTLRAHAAGFKEASGDGTRVYCSGGRQPEQKNSTVDDKAARYLSERRVTVLRCMPGDVEARVRGSAAEPYTVRFNGALWTCSCEAHIWRCAHVVAVQMVTAGSQPDPEDTGPSTEDPFDALLGPRWLQRTGTGEPRGES